MSGTQRLPGARHLLAIMVTALSGHALADVAGKVNFVSGPVMAYSLDGNQRLLTRGAEVNGGERLETGKGRLQIRFTDGSFLSLQPNTIFRLDSYRFEKNKPEEGQLLFNFVQGGMRTITGAIGRVNRARYKVRTPVASLGIRGTGYASTLNNGVLTLSVDKGIVNIENEFGSSNVNAGQTFRVIQGEAPRLAPDGVSADARAREPDNNFTTAGNDRDINSNPETGAEVIAGENPDFGQVVVANVLPDSNYPPGSGVPLPSYTLASRFEQTGNSLLLSGLGAIFNRTASDAGRGGLVGLTETRNNSISAIFHTGSAGNALQFNGITTIGDLSFGEWTNGGAANGTLDRTDGNITLGDGQFEPYIIGASSSQALGLDAAGQGVKLSYLLAGATVAGSTNGEAGVLRNLSLNITLAPVSLVDVDLKVSMQNTGDYVASARNLMINNNNASTSSGLRLNGNDLTATGQGCTGRGCAVRLEAFFAGDDPQLGAIYVIDRTSSQISGVAALDLSGKTTASVLLADAASPDYRAVFVKHGGVYQENAISADFASNGNWQSGTVSSNSVYGPNSQASVAAVNQGVAHVNHTLAWGQWVNGSAQFGNGNTVDLNSQGVHYLVGSPTVSGNLPNSVLTYNLLGGSRPTLADANGAPASASGILTSGTMTLDFEASTASLNLGMAFAAGSQTASVLLSGSQGMISSGNVGFDSLNVSVGSNAGTPIACTSCSGSASGFVAGPSAEMVGLGYAVNGVTVLQTDNGSISGVATFGNPKP